MLITILWFLLTNPDLRFFLQFFYLILLIDYEECNGQKIWGTCNWNWFRHFLLMCCYMARTEQSSWDHSKWTRKQNHSFLGMYNNQKLREFSISSVLQIKYLLPTNAPRKLNNQDKDLSEQHYRRKYQHKNYYFQHCFTSIKEWIQLSSSTSDKSHLRLHTDKPMITNSQNRTHYIFIN